MEFFKSNTKINFMGQRRLATLFSGLLFAFCIGSLLINGLNLGLDFTGGTQLEFSFEKAPHLEQIRQKVHQAGFSQAVVQNYGSAREILVRVGENKQFTQEQLKERITLLIPDGKIEQLQYIGPQVGRSLVTQGILAILISLLATMLYVALRFEYRFALSAVVALIHDPIVILGLFAFFHIQFDLISLAALLTIIGYSLNDTIVVYDRARENFRKMRKNSPLEIMNASINQTLSRTIITSGLTLLVVIALFIYGGEVLRGFALALIIGIIIGTYSSIYVAGSLAVSLGLKPSDLLPISKQELDDTP